MSRPTSMREEYAQDQHRKRLYQGALEAMRKVVNAEEDADYAARYRAPMVDALAKLEQRIERIDGVWN